MSGEIDVWGGLYKNNVSKLIPWRNRRQELRELPEVAGSCHIHFLILVQKQLRATKNTSKQTTIRCSLGRVPNFEQKNIISRKTKQDGTAHCFVGIPPVSQNKKLMELKLKNFEQKNWTLFSYSVKMLLSFRFILFHFLTRNRLFSVTQNFAKWPLYFA
jgi:hypothetical protein